MTTYPTRARIVDVVEHPNSPAHKLATAVGMTPTTPSVSKPHVGKEGLAERTPEGVRITLDDGTVLYGYECWWEPLSE